MKGDNIFTAISVTKESGIIEHDSKLFIGSLEENEVSWSLENVDQVFILDPKSLLVIF